MTTVFHTWPYGRFIEKESNLRRKKLHRTNQGSNFFGGSFSNRDNVRAPIQFKRESQPRHLKRLFFLRSLLTLRIVFVIINCCISSSLQRCSIKKDVLKKFAIFAGKHLCWSLFLIKLQAFRPDSTYVKECLRTVASLISEYKKCTQHR